jgi:hypothetical protein
MRDIELYRALLGLTAPWTVAGVDVDMAGLRVDAGAGPYPCPECGTPGSRYDGKPPSPGAGAISTRCSSRPGSRPRCPACRARPTGSRGGRSSGAWRGGATRC